MSDFSSVLDHIAREHRLIGLSSIYGESQTGYMAMAMAERLMDLGHSCLIVEMNNDHPEINMLTGVTPSDWDGSIENLDDGIVRLPNELSVLLASSLSGGVYRTQAWIESLLKACREKFDYCIVRMPAILQERIRAAEPSTITAVVDTVILVTVARRDTQSDLVRSVDAIGGGQASTHITGVVVNDFANPKLSEMLADAISPKLRNYPLLNTRLRNWLEKVTIFNIQY